MSFLFVCLLFKLFCWRFVSGLVPSCGHFTWLLGYSTLLLRVDTIRPAILWESWKVMRLFAMWQLVDSDQCPCSRTNVEHLSPLLPHNFYVKLLPLTSQEQLVNTPFVGCAHSLFLIFIGFFYRMSGDHLSMAPAVRPFVCYVS